MGDRLLARHEDIRHTFLLGRAREAPWKPQAAKTLLRVCRAGQSATVMTPTLPVPRTPSPCPGLCPASPPRPAFSSCVCLCPSAGAVPGHTPDAPWGQRGAGHTAGAVLGSRPGVGPAPALPPLQRWLRSAAPPGPGREGRPPPPGPDGHLRWGPVPPGALPAAGRTPARLRQGCRPGGGRPPVRCRKGEFLSETREFIPLGRSGGGSGTGHG